MFYNPIGAALGLSFLNFCFLLPYLEKQRIKYFPPCAGSSDYLSEEDAHYAKEVTRIWPYHYCRDYDSKRRFISYWHQVNEILLLDPGKVFEVGVGNGFVANYLTRNGIKVTTVDIDRRLNPDMVGSVLKIPFPDRSFDIVSCCEVLEHLPYDDFTKGLSELYRVSRQYVVLSLPDVGVVCRIGLQLPRIAKIKRLIPLPRLRRPMRNLRRETLPPGKDDIGYSIPHCWQIGESDCPLHRIKKDIEAVGFKFRKTYRIFEYPLHRFFALMRDASNQEPARRMM